MARPPLSYRCGMKDDLESVKKSLAAKRPAGKLLPQDMLSTGSTLLNLACSGRPTAGFAKGQYYFLVGDSSSGKSWLSLSCLAEATFNKNYDQYRLIQDDAEGGTLMDFEKYFGKRVAARVEPPDTRNGDPVYSKTVEDFYFNLDRAFGDGRPFVYVLDSMDCLTTLADLEKFTDRRVAHDKVRKAGGSPEDLAGSYGTAKAKLNSNSMPSVIARLKQTGSILIIIAQTRDNIGTFTMEKKTRSGGHALKFYACLELWSSVKGPIKKTVRGKDRQLGIHALVRVKKNRQTGRDRRVVIPIYHSFGIDDVGGNVDYLLEEGHWKKKGSTISAPEFEFEGNREQLVAHVEEQDMERRLQMLVARVWNEIEEACEIPRKFRYEG
jgi:recA bacterial DNA recombination protein